MTVAVKVVFNRFPELIGGLEAKAEAVVTQAALEIEQGMKDRAPVDTGNLKSSIHVVDSARLTKLVGTNVFYAAYQEFGTARNPAHPFAIPAAEEVRPRFIAAMEAVLSL